ncbi:type I-B CRISPR-associated protein Cas7/Cst2/DevR [Fervidobacterium sp.]
MEMRKRILTASFVSEASSLNYGEGIGNYSELKKLTRGNGQQYTFISRQALRYDIVRLGHELFGWNLQVVSKEKGTVQFRDDVTIQDSVEMDLFGYMKTEKGGSGLTRSAAVRLTHAISLEPYRNDLEFLTNKGMADRINEDANLANIETHMSFYTYTIAVDLENVGVDINDKRPVTLEKEERANRVLQLLEILRILNRNIRGRIENLSPVFAIGGIYPIPSPLFLGSIKLRSFGGRFEIDLAPLNEVMEMTLEVFGNVYKPKDDTKIGVRSGVFGNEDEIKKLSGATDINSFFEDLKAKVREFYGVNGK